MIKIENLSKEFYYGKTTQKVLKSVNFSIEDGEFVTIMGPSGGGKTTLLNSIALLLEPTSGEIYYDNEKINFNKERKMEKFRRDNIGLIFQNSNLISCLSPLENIIIAMNSKEVYSNKKKVAEELLDKVGLKNKGNSRIEALSGGEAQRVAIVRALINNPKVLLCDEPTGALDSRNSELVVKLLNDVRKEKKCTLVLVTHDERIGALGERKIVLRDGVLHEVD